ncbi:recombinase RecT [Hufsiella ginkgonis]|uniref:Serine/threonine protein kinase n=1 Tax=Hufsiella ginkgonis TaxID=2695274 RepID=A0A7K1Y2F4_9SPHI|nr:recombinase RecT [Hufsiella ginkgonis]MXV16866.1 serine/threonine protein kinase [Hufsiella ginkgonis]
MSATTQNVMAVLKQANPLELVEIDFVKDRFISLHNQFTGSQRGDQEYHLQVFNYKKMMAEKPELRDCSPLSLYGAFLDINVNGLSLEQGSKPDCYITHRSFKIGSENGQDIYEKRAQLSISPYGELKMRLRSGQIKYADSPVIVYEGDKFSVRTTAQGKTVDHEAVIPRTSKRIIASFIRLVRADGTADFFVMTEEDITRLKGYSNRNNRGNANSDKSNALYTSNGGQIDPGFLAAKTIKHAFRTYPKVAVGKFSEVEPEEVIVPGAADYGIDPDQYSANATTTDITHEEVPADDFDAALKAELSQEEEVLTIADDEDEPNFN